MKLIISMCFTLLVAIAAQSQKKTFVRVFDEAGRKTHKGFLTATSDSSLTILSGEKIFEIPINQVSEIKLRRSFGHTVLVSSLIVGVSFAILGGIASTASVDATYFDYTTGQAVAGGLLFGAGSGAIIGSIINALQKRPAFNVNMNHEEWMKVKEQLKKYLPATIN